MVVVASESNAGTRERLKERRTSGDSSSSTLRAERAMRARREVGKGVWIVLGVVSPGWFQSSLGMRVNAYRECGNWHWDEDSGCVFDCSFAFVFGRVGTMAMG